MGACCASSSNDHSLDGLAVPPGAPLASGATRLPPAPPPPSEQIGRAAVGADVKPPSLATIPEAGGGGAVSPEFEPESTLEVESDSPVVIDYDRLFCASSNPEYAEYRHAWRLAQDEYHSLLARHSTQPPVVAELDGGTCTGGTHDRWSCS